MRTRTVGSAVLLAVVLCADEASGQTDVVPQVVPLCVGDCQKILDEITFNFDEFKGTTTVDSPFLRIRNQDEPRGALALHFVQTRDGPPTTLIQTAAWNLEDSPSSVSAHVLGRGELKLLSQSSDIDCSGFGGCWDVHTFYDFAEILVDAVYNEEPVRLRSYFGSVHVTITLEQHFLLAFYHALQDKRLTIAPTSGD